MSAVPSLASSEIVVVHGPGGGMGRTTIALHLAYMYAAKGLKTLLVDLSQYGTITTWLRLPRGLSSGVTGLLAAQEQNSGVLPRLRGVVPAPGTSDLLWLLLSSGPAKMDQITANAMTGLLQGLGDAAQVVIVDTGSELTERTLGALMAATKIALTISPQVVAGWQALELLEILRSAYIARERTGLVLSRVQPGSRYPLEEYRQELGIPLLGVIPEAPELRTASEAGGVPHTHGSKPGLIALRKLAHQLVPVFSEKELRRSWVWSR